MNCSNRRLLGLLLLLSACADSVSGPGGGEAGIQMVIGHGVTDTVQARPTQALTVQVNGPDGKPVPGAVVRFESVPAASGSGATPSVSVGSLAAASFASLVVDSTDSQGRASVRVALGTRAGAGGVAVIVPVFGYQDTARYTIRPGALARVVSTPADTTVFIGRTVPLRSSLSDRHGNLVEGAATFSVASGPATVAGGAVTGEAFGRAMVIARSGTLADTSYVSVVPQGTITAYATAHHTGHRVTLYTLDLDGSNLKMVAPTVVGSGYFGDMPAAWLRGGNRLVYHDNNRDHTKQLYVYDMASGTSSRLLPPGQQLEHEAWPRTSADGEWVYFNGGPFSTQAGYRVRADGTGREKVTPDWCGNVAPSRDGTRVVCQSQTGLSVVDLRTRVATSLGTPGTEAVWIPSGNEIAFLSAGGEIRVVRPDGTGLRTLLPSGTRFQGRFDFSPDGKFIVGAATSGSGLPGLRVVEVATGLSVPITTRAGDQQLLAPMWKP